MHIAKIIGCTTMLAATIACAQLPERDIDPHRHGNLAAAQQLVVQAYERLGDAQAANDSQLGGHAGRARELLREANQEIKLAAIAANHR